MKGASLRLRVFLFFCLLAAGSVAIILTALWFGFRQLGNPDAVSAFVTSAIISGFGIFGLTVSIWLLFDENVSKPIERLAARLRVQTHVDVASDPDPAMARHLGDLAPATLAIQQKLNRSAKAVSEAVGRETAKLTHQRDQLLQILSDIPVAVIVANQDHQIVLYDGQASALMEAEAPVRLNATVFEYLEKSAVEKALAALTEHGLQYMPLVIKGRSGALYTGHIRLFGDEAGYTLMLEPLDPEAERPLVYDFDLLEQAWSPDLHDAALRDLTFVVFDSETTGLDPEKDEVVQLGAVRIVNGKLVAGEVFETLVNPGVPVPASSTRVHGIDDGMVADAPAFSQACGDFHDFARGAVIVAHNALFDMSFLRRQAKETGIQFDHPVLDTVHLSAIVFGGSAVHTLDALCERLSVRIPPEVRHTALGDAVATAQVLVAMLPILEGRGIGTFGQLVSEAGKFNRILSTDA